MDDKERLHAYSVIACTVSLSSQGTDYLFIVDLKKKSRRLPPALLFSPDRADMDWGIDRLSREI